MSLEALVKEFLLERRAISVGIATVETLSGGPPSADITYRMEGARSAVSFALPVNGGITMYRFWRFIFVHSISSIYEFQPSFPFALVSFTLSFKRKESPLRFRTWQ